MSAVISPCGQYRYLLTREGDLVDWRGPAVFIMLNPSTADATEDDATIRRCRRFAETWGCNGIKVVNLYALRSTDPAGLWEHSNPIGPDNDEWISRVASTASVVVCAWGVNAQPWRVRAVVDVLKLGGLRLMCLGKTQNGSPRHPLYVRGDQPLIDWSPKQ